MTAITVSYTHLVVNILCLAQDMYMLFLIKDGGEADESPCVLSGIQQQARKKQEVIKPAVKHAVLVQTVPPCCSRYPVSRCV